MSFLSMHLSAYFLGWSDLIAEKSMEKKKRVQILNVMLILFQFQNLESLP